MSVMVRPLESTDGAKVLAIYAEAIKGPNASFETNVPVWSEWQKTHLPAHRFVAINDAKKLLGWAALSRFSIVRMAELSRRRVLRIVGL